MTDRLAKSPLLPRWAALLCGGVLTALTACSAPRFAWTPDLDVAQARTAAEALLQQADTRAEGHQRLGWLCLLYGDGCADLPEHGRQASAGTRTGHLVDAQAILLTALALQGQPDIAPRAQAWLAVLETGLVLQADRSQGDALMTLGAEALSRLAVRDRQAVVRQVAVRPDLARAALATGEAEPRWRRTLALGSLLAEAVPGNLPSLEALRVPLQVVARVEPVSRRLYTGLQTLGDTAPAAMDLSAEPTRAALDLVPLPLDAAQLLLPLPLQTGRYPLPARDPGVYLLRAQFDGGQGGKRLVLVRAPRGLRLWVQGRLAVDTAARQGAKVERDRLVRAWIDARPGANRLDLALALAGNAEVLELDVLQPAPALSPVGAEPAPWLATWPEALRDVARALLDPDGPARTRLARQFAKGPAAALVSVDTAASLDAQRTASAAVLDRLLDALPWHQDAQIDRVAKVREAGNPGLAWQMLRQVVERPDQAVVIQHPETRRELAGGRADLALERANVLLALGLNDEAVLAAARAVRMQPNDCEVFERALTLGMDALDRPLLRQLLRRPAQETPRCPDRALTVAMAQATTGDLAAAHQTLTRALQQPAQAREAWQRLTAMADAGGEPAVEVPTWLEDPTVQTWRVAQSAALRHDAVKSRATLATLLAAPGHPLEARQKAIQAGAPAPWQAFERAGEPIAQQPDDLELVQGASTAWLLDQEIVLLLPGGGALRRVHQIVRVLKDEAAEAVGEVRVAEGADLEFARTLLPDGTVVLPAETADKETISLRAVEAGTAVEFAQLAYVAPDDPATGATRLPAFVLQASDAPTRLTEYVVLVPQGVTARFETSASAPQAEVTQIPRYTVHTWRRQAVPRFRNEPRSVRPDLAVPSVRTTVQADLTAVLGPWNETLAAWLDLRDDDLDRWLDAARKLPAGKARWQAIATRLAQAVQHAHEGGTPGRPDSTLRNGKGDRAAVLYTLAKRLGEDACLVRVLPLARLPGRDPPDPEDWGLELVRIRLPAGELWYDPGLEGGLVDHLRAGLRGRSGLLAGCAKPLDDKDESQAWPRVTVPRLGDGQDHRAIAVAMQWQADGRVQAEVRDTLKGALAALVRSWLVASTEANRKEILEQLTGSSFAGLTVAWRDVIGLELLPGAPLTLVYEATGAAEPTRGNVLDLPLYPDQLGQTYAGLANRRTRLLFSHSLDVELDVTVRSARPWTALPAAVDVVHPLVQYHRQADLTAGALHVRKTLVARPAVVEAADYMDLARRLREIDAADVVRLER